MPEKKKIVSEAELIKTVFSNDQGLKLLDYWNEYYCKRISHYPDNSPQHTAFMEGQRSFCQGVINIFEEETK